MVEGFTQSLLAANEASSSNGTAHKDAVPTLSQEIVQAGESVARQELIKDIRRLSADLTPEIRELLLRCAAAGISMHHARLPRSILDRVVQAFREGTIRCICCTTTLSVGVNLPADVVFIRRVNGWLGSDLPRRCLPAPKFCQIEGRCGRGQDKNCAPRRSEGDGPLSAAAWLGEQPTTILVSSTVADRTYARKLVDAVAADGGGITRENQDIGASVLRSSLVPHQVAEFLLQTCCAESRGAGQQLMKQVSRSGESTTTGSTTTSTCIHQDTSTACLIAESHPLSAFLLDAQLAGMLSASDLQGSRTIPAELRGVGSPSIRRIQASLLLGHLSQGTQQQADREQYRFGVLVSACMRRIGHLGLMQFSLGHDQRLALALSASGVGLDAGMQMGRSAQRFRSRMGPSMMSMLLQAVPDECIERSRPEAGDTGLPVVSIRWAACLTAAALKTDQALALHLDGVRADELIALAEELDRPESRYTRLLRVRLNVLQSPTADQGLTGEMVSFTLDQVRERRESILRAGWACLFHLGIKYAGNFDLLVSAIRRSQLSTSDAHLTARSIQASLKLLRRSSRGLTRLYQQLGWQDAERPMRLLAEMIAACTCCDDSSVQLQKVVGCSSTAAARALSMVSADAYDASGHVRHARAIISTYKFIPSRRSTMVGLPKLAEASFEPSGLASIVNRHLQSTPARGAAVLLSRLTAMATGSGQMTSIDASGRQPAHRSTVPQAMVRPAGRDPDSGVVLSAQVPIGSMGPSSGQDSLVVRSRDVQSDASSVLSSAFGDSSDTDSYDSGMSSDDMEAWNSSDADDDINDSDAPGDDSDGSISDEEGLKDVLIHVDSDDAWLQDQTSHQSMHGRLRASGVRTSMLHEPHATAHSPLSTPMDSMLACVQAGAISDPDTSMYDARLTNGSSVSQAQGEEIHKKGGSRRSIPAPDETSGIEQSGVGRFLPWTAPTSQLVSPVPPSVPASARIHSTPRAPRSLRDAIRDTLHVFDESMEQAGRKRPPRFPGVAISERSKIPKDQGDQENLEVPFLNELNECMQCPVIAFQVVLRPVPAGSMPARWRQLFGGTLLASPSQMDEAHESDNTPGGILDDQGVMLTAAMAIRWGIGKHEQVYVPFPSARVLPTILPQKAMPTPPAGSGEIPPGWGIVPVKILRAVFSFITEASPSTRASNHHLSCDSWHRALAPIGLVCKQWRHSALAEAQDNAALRQKQVIRALQSMFSRRDATFVAMNMAQQLRWLAQVGLSVCGSLCDPVIGSRMLRQATWHDYDGGVPHLADLLNHCADLCASSGGIIEQEAAPTGGGMEGILRRFATIAVSSHLTSHRPFVWRYGRVRIAGSSMSNREFLVLESTGDVTRASGRLHHSVAATMLGQAAILCTSVLLPCLKSLGLHKVFLLQEMPLQRALTAMQMTGLAVDVQKLQRLRARARLTLVAIQHDILNEGSQQPLVALLTSHGAAIVLLQHHSHSDILQCLHRGIRVAQTARARSQELRLATPGRCFEAKADEWKPNITQLERIHADLGNSSSNGSSVIVVSRMLRHREAVYCLMAFGPPRMAVSLRAVLGTRSSLRLLWHCNALHRSVQWQAAGRHGDIGQWEAVVCPQLVSCGPTGRIIASGPALQSLPAMVRLPRLTSPSQMEMMPGLDTVAGASQMRHDFDAHGTAVVWVANATALGAQLALARCRARGVAGGRLSKPTMLQSAANVGIGDSSGSGFSTSTSCAPASAGPPCSLLRRGILHSILPPQWTAEASLRALTNAAKGNASQPRVSTSPPEESNGISLAEYWASRGVPLQGPPSRHRVGMVQLAGGRGPEPGKAMTLLPYPLDAVYPDRPRGGILHAGPGGESMLAPRLPGVLDLPQFGCTRPWAVIQDASLLRGCIRARAGCSILSCDYSAIELRLLAWLSGDTKLRDILRTAGRDSAVAFEGVMRALGLPHLGRDKRTAKLLVYGVVYGMGARTLGKQLGLSIAASRLVLATFLRVFPGVKELCVSAWKGALACGGTVSTLGGRRRMVVDRTEHGGSYRYAGGRGENEGVHRGRKRGGSSLRGRRQALSTLVQGSAADVLQRAIMGVWGCIVKGDTATGGEQGGMAVARGAIASSGGYTSSEAGAGAEAATKHTALDEAPRTTFAWKDCRLLLPVHDEMLVEVPTAVVGHAARCIARIMEVAGRGLGVDIALPVKAAAGDSWGDLRSIDIEPTAVSGSGD